MSDSGRATPYRVRAGDPYMQGYVWVVEYLWKDDWGVEQATLEAIHRSEKGARRKLYALRRSDGTAKFEMREVKTYA